MDIEIRLERESDFLKAYSVVERAFDSSVEADLVKALRRSASPRISLVAEYDGDIVGHIFFSPVSLKGGAHHLPIAQLSPVSVLPKFQRKGIGSQLIRTGLEECDSVGSRAVFLVGNPFYYSRFGFCLAGDKGFSYPGQYDPYLQVLELETDVLSEISGEIELHTAFAEVGAE